MAFIRTEINPTISINRAVSPPCHVIAAYLLVALQMVTQALDTSIFLLVCFRRSLMKVFAVFAVQAERLPIAMNDGTGLRIYQLCTAYPRPAIILVLILRSAPALSFERCW
jgi:hypothetical protein